MSTVLVDFQNREVNIFIKEKLALDRNNVDSPYITIPKDQFTHYQWAKAYEEFEPIVSDEYYDMHTRYLQREKSMFPEIWEEVSLTCFRDGSWEYTGLFIESHNEEDEEWLL